MAVGIGIHICECCGSIFETLGPYWDCQDSHSDEELAAHGLMRKPDES